MNTRTAHRHIDNVANFRRPVARQSAEEQRIAVLVLVFFVGLVLLDLWLF